MKPGYKQTEVGVIPEEWEVKRFGNLYAEPSRNGIYKAAAFQGRGTRIVNMGEMFGLEFISDQEMSRVSLTSKEIAASGLRDGDLLFGRRSVVPAGAGKCSLVVGPPEPLTFESSIIRVRLVQAEGDPLFHYYYFASSAGRSVMGVIISGTNVKGIRGSELRELTIPVPPIPEQRAIAAALSEVDALLAALDRLIAKKRDLKQSAMQQLLTGQTRLPGFEGEWVVKTFGELFTFSGSYSASRDELSDEGHCYLHYGDIHTSSRTTVDVTSDFAQIPKLDIPLKRVAPSSLLEDGDVVFVDASEDDDGVSKHVVVVNKERKPFISGLHTIVAKAKTDGLVHAYRRFCFHTRAIKEQFKFYAVGTKVSGISKSNIPKLTLPLPSQAEQTAIAAVLSDMDAELAALEQRREKTRALKQGMMQELLTGRTRLV